MQAGVKVFVGNVPEEASQVELRDLFEAAVPGEVLKVALMKQFAFVHLRDDAAADRAIQKLNGHLLHCHRVVVELSRPRPTHTVKIFVGNVSAACTSGELRVLFQEFGPVVECDIVKGHPAWADHRESHHDKGDLDPDRSQTEFRLPKVPEKMRHRTSSPSEPNLGALRAGRLSPALLRPRGNQVSPFPTGPNCERRPRAAGGSVAPPKFGSRSGGPGFCEPLPTSHPPGRERKRQNCEKRPG